MIHTSEKQKEKLKLFDKEISKLVDMRSYYIAALMDGADVSAEDKYELDEDYNLKKMESGD